MPERKHWRLYESPTVQPLLRLPRVIEITGLRRSSIYAYVARGDFPQPVRLGVRAVAWRSEDLEAWVAGRPQRASVVVPACR